MDVLGDDDLLWQLITAVVMGGWLCISTENTHRTHQELKDREVELTEEPTQRPYGIDFGLRDPFGNAIRIGQMNPPAS